MNRRLNKISLTVSALVLSFVFIFINQAYGEHPTYSKVRIYLSGGEDFVKLSEIGLVFDHIDFHETYFDAVLNNWEVGLLQDSSWQHEILIEDLESDYRNQPKPSQAVLEAQLAEVRTKFNLQCFGFGSMGGYYTFSEIVAKLDEMSSNFPSIITAKQSIGTSIEGRDIWMVKISDNPNIDETNEEEVLYTAIHHAREAQAQATVMFFMCYMLENYGSDPVVTHLIDNRELYFIPCINPDGYVYNEITNPNGGGLWRKNRRENGGGSFGVDLNRNYDYQWGFNNQGSSPNPNSSTYRGTSPASEPEIQAVQNFVISREFTLAFNYHAFASSFNFPWGYLPNFFTPDHSTFVALSSNYSQFNNYRYGTPWTNLGYVTNGYSNDWFYGEQTQKSKVFSWTVEESGNSFWPPQTSIIPFAQNNVFSNLAMANGFTGDAPPIISVTLTPQNPPIVIPSGGGSFTFDITLTNVTNFEWTFDVWNSIIDPNGEPMTTMGPFNPSFGPGHTANFTITQDIPGSAQAGTYTFLFNTGTFSIPEVISSSQFTFTKSSIGPAAKSSGGSWTASVDYQSDPAIETGLPATNTEDDFLAGEEVLPDEFGLAQNYPNPFNPSTTIAYQLSKAEKVEIIVYDLAGRQVRQLVNESKAAGSYTVLWDGKNRNGQRVASGLYIYQIRVGQFNQNRKMLFLK